MNYIKTPQSTIDGDATLEPEEQYEGQSFETFQEQFTPHYGNNCVFYFKNGQPQITVGPHWPLSVCLLISIFVATYFISFKMNYKKNWLWKSASLISGLHLAASFLAAALKNPGISTAYSKTIYQKGYCKACLTFMEIDTVHCLDCDICIRGHDHHCPWTGKCIGSGNMLQFQWFLCAFIIFFLLSITTVIA